MARFNDNPFSTHFNGPRRSGGVYDDLQAIAEKLMASGVDEDRAYELAADRCETKNEILAEKGKDWD